MTCSVTLAWDDALTRYDFGAGHPMAPVRVELTMALARSLGVIDRMRLVGVDVATDEQLRLVHTPGYIEGVRIAGESFAGDRAFGLGTPDNPVFAKMHEASARVVGATLAASNAVLSADSQHAVNITGGLHHAMPDHASGFCIYNDPAIAIASLLDAGIERIAYVDVDAHHGDGVERVFWDDPRVLTISLHESGRTLFPGSGFAAEIGGGGAAGSAVNIALPAGTGDSGWSKAFETVVPELLKAWRPEFLVSQHGADSHALDPLTHLMLSVDGQRTASLRLHELAHEHCDGRWLAVGGGGYATAAVVPRTWTHLLAIAADEPIDPATETPDDWRAAAMRRTGVLPPPTMGDTPPVLTGGRSDSDDEAVERAIRATTDAVFGLHQLGTT